MRISSTLKKPSLKIWKVTDHQNGVLRPFKAQSHCADQYEHTPRKDIILHTLKPKASIKRMASDDGDIG